MAEHPDTNVWKYSVSDMSSQLNSGKRKAFWRGGILQSFFLRLPVLQFLTTSMILASFMIESWVWHGLAVQKVFERPFQALQASK
jgi:hypothetical protein